MPGILSLDRVSIANFVSGVFVGVTVCVDFSDSISEFVIFYGFFMVWSRVGWGIGSRSVVDGGVVDGDREMERGSMVYKWCSVVHRGGMEGCVVYRGTEDTVVNGGSMKGVGMGMGGKSDIAFGTKGFMGVLVGSASVMTLVLVGYTGVM